MTSSVIITGVDGSDTARIAARTAARLAAALQAQLRIVCAYLPGDVEQLEVGGEHYELSNEASARTVAEETVVALEADYPDLEMVPVASPGKPAEALVQVAEQSDAELIVIGNRRVQGTSRIFGSVASHIAHRAPCDVYIAHTHSR